MLRPQPLLAYAAAGLAAASLVACGSGRTSGPAYPARAELGLTLDYLPVGVPKRCPGHTGSVPDTHLPGLGVAEVSRMTCARAVRAMLRIAPVLGVNYYDHLGDRRNELVAGYRCSGHLVGDAAWDIVCVRGGAWFVAWAAE